MLGSHHALEVIDGSLETLIERNGRFPLQDVACLINDRPSTARIGSLIWWRRVVPSSTTNSRSPSVLGTLARKWSAAADGRTLRSRDGAAAARLRPLADELRDLLSGFDRLLHCVRRNATGHRHAELGKNFLALVLVNLHEGVSRNGF